MVPGNFGCGSAVLAAIATLAPSRAARSPIASPMPREAPVMNRGFPWSGLGSCSDAFSEGDIAWEGDMATSLSARQESRKGGARFVRLQEFAEVRGFGVYLLEHVVQMAAHQQTRHGKRFRRQRGDLLR